MSIRNSAKAIIFKDDHVLLTQNKHEENLFYLFPGGGQEFGENLHQALKRECMEEIGAEIEVGELVFIREFIGPNLNHPLKKDIHQVEYYFICHLVDEDLHESPTNPDSYQIGIEWVKVANLLDYQIYPMAIREHVINHWKGNKGSVYLGEIN